MLVGGNRFPDIYEDEDGKESVLEGVFGFFIARKSFVSMCECARA